MNRVIDPHIHFFDLQKGRYAWLQEGSEPNWPKKESIRKDYLEADLKLDTSIDLAGFVHIEAGFDNDAPWRELVWLEEHCSLPFKSIAYGDLQVTSFPETLGRLSKFDSLVGIRFILDHQAATLLNNPIVKQNLVLLSDAGLLFEAQFPLSDKQAVDALSGVMDELPQLKVVINHTGSPELLSENWMNGIMRLAHHPECSIKCSGWEMFNWEWDTHSIKPMISFAIRQFGLTRVMLASNFPVSELSCSYAELWQRYLNEMKWKGFEKDMLVYENAKRIYQFD